MKQWFMLGSAALLVALAGCGSAGGPAAKPQQAAAASAAPALAPAPGASGAAEPAPAAKGAAPTGAAKPGAARQDAVGDDPAAKQQVVAVAPASAAQAPSPTAAAGSSASAPSAALTAAASAAPEQAAAAPATPAQQASAPAAAAAPATTEITVSIIGDKQHGVILQATSVPFQEGATVIDVLKQVTKANKIQMEYKGAGKYAYVQGIDNLYEFDGGPKSGWVYKVNGAAPSEGAGSYKAAAGDKIEWLYTLDLGKDVGAVQK
jgi:hypothetical protein